MSLIVVGCFCLRRWIFLSVLFVSTYWLICLLVPLRSLHLFQHRLSVLPCILFSFSLVFRCFLYWFYQNICFNGYQFLYVSTFGFFNSCSLVLSFNIVFVPFTILLYILYTVLLCRYFLFPSSCFLFPHVHFHWSFYNRRLWHFIIFFLNYFDFRLFYQFYFFVRYFFRFCIINCCFKYETYFFYRIQQSTIERLFLQT